MKISAPQGSIALAALLFCATSLKAAPAQTGVLVHDRWLVLQQSGKDVGYEHAAMRRVGTGPRELLVTTQHMAIDLHLGARSVKSVREITWTERPDGSLVSVVTQVVRGGRLTTEEVEFSGGKAHVTTKVLGKSRERDVVCAQPVVGPHHLEVLEAEKLKKSGDAFDAPFFSLGHEAATRVHETAVGIQETRLLDGSTKSLLRVSRTEEGVPVAATLWLGPAGVPEKLETGFASVSVVGYLATRKRALSVPIARGESKEASPPARATPRPICAVPHPRRVEGAILEIAPKDQQLNLAAMHLGLASDGQTVESRSGNGILLHSIRRVPPEGKTGTRPLQDAAPALAEYLAPSFLVQSDAKAIRDVAEREVGAVRDGWKAVKELERFVHGWISKELPAAPLVRALDVLRSRQGDCKAHAVLFCALCRAAGIPCRIAVGLEYAPRDGSWAGHAWNEVFLDGAWYPVDPTNGYGFVDPLHLRLAAGCLRDGSLSFAFAKLGVLVGTIDISVKEVTYRGKTYDLAALKTGWGGTHYANPAWGISFDLPDGGRLDPPTHRSGLVLAAYRCKDADGAVSAEDMRPGTTFAQILHGRKAESVEVGGVPAAILPVKKHWHVLVFDGKSLFVFVDYGSRSALDALLKTVCLQ